MTDQQLMTFRDLLRTFEQPEKWELRVSPINGTLGEARAISLPPKVDGLEVEVWCAANGVTPGEYRLSLEPIADNESTYRAARSRQRKRGPLNETVTITDQHVVESAEAKRNGEAKVAERAAARTEHMRRLNGAPPKTASGKPDDALDQVRRATELARAEAERATAELALRKARRELDREEGSGRAPAGGSASPGLGWLTALAPLASMLVEKFTQSAERREKMLAEAIAARASEGPAFQIAPESSTPSTGLTLDSLAALVPAIKDLFGLFRDFGGDATGEPRSQFGEIAELVKALAPALLPPQAGPRNRIAKVQAAQDKNPEEAKMNLGQMRVIGWLSKVQREAAVPSDPAWAANVLAVSEQPPAPFGALPREFQELVLQNSPEGVVAGLSRWMPAAAFTALQSHLQGSEPARRWLAEFIIAVQEGLTSFEDEQGDEDEELDEPAEPASRNGVT